MTLTEVLNYAVDQTPADRVGLYAMVSALGVAFIAGLFGVINARMGNKPSRNAGERKAAREHQAWERWFLLNDIDCRKIKTGYEHMEEVKFDA